MKTVNLFESLTREKLQTIKGGTIATSKYTSIVDIDNEDDEDDEDGGITITGLATGKTSPIIKP
ncbi:hypothetical protein CXF68_07420 [Tenacibaculum sp. Bg11-29]|uniref:ComC/BlpC family leader-containing pheromone/bacteriocin n=1 Tax=Tenacibaculum sp. Bg11-29 TaxID=2058306 RepID=UPI000C34C0BB|nr:ComC/BlpC family leader-containing pheromone/bacteriocin [Tenacibaculum sp. Bg11-29]PKH50535.1 hypothetical protein CXF68_07420 [Tenacibaculum sp. Bg11-29]